MDSNYLGPLILSYRQKDLLCYVFHAQGYHDAIKVYYGCAFFYFVSRPLVYHIGSASFDEIAKSPVLLNNLKAQMVKLLDSTGAIDKFEKHGIYLAGKMYLTPTTAYVLGEKKSVKYSPSFPPDPSCFYGKDYASVQKTYESLALAHFEKRVAYYEPLMGIKTFEKVGLSDAIDYIGRNSIRAHKIILNKALYAFRSQVGDAVVVHELAHCLEANHSKSFYDIVLKYCPDYYRLENIILSGSFEAF
jgi:predicted metal-dependent hydrolase